MNELQDRTGAFLKQPIPEGMDYVPDSLSERFLAEYARDGRLALEAEIAEILAMMVEDADSDESMQYNPGEREYIRESQQLLKEILDEEIRRPSWPAPYLLAGQPSKKPWWRFW
jgi:hypothetical protein